MSIPDQLFEAVLDIFRISQLFTFQTCISPYHGIFLLAFGPRDTSQSTKGMPISNQTRFDGEKQNRNLSVIGKNAKHFGRETVEYIITVSIANSTSFDGRQQGKCKSFKKRIMLCPVF